MIPWWWALIAWVIGEIMAIIEVIICMGGNSKKEELEQLEKAGLLYPEGKTLGYVTYDELLKSKVIRETIKKAADAGTSTAAHMGRKDYFL